MIAGLLTESAKKKGANSAKLIPVREIFVEDYVRLKCQYGCDEYSRCFTCPPFSPTSDETRRMLKNYNWALLVEFAGLAKKADQRGLHDVMFELEREAFLNGFHRAFSFTAGPCRLCDVCPAEEIENLNEYSKKYCKNPEKARPSMEACGIDVYRTARNAGYQIEVVKEGEIFKSFSLLLLE